MSPQARTEPRLRRATPKTRQSVTQLSAPAVNRLRKAIHGALDRPDNRGYQFFAGWHGVPLGICEHHNELFLPWHRGYLYHFELALQDIDPDVTVPWWNWMDEPGIPQAYDVKRISGKANILASAPIKPLTPQRPGWPRKTHREVGAPPPPGFPAPLAPPLGAAHLPGTPAGGAWAWMMAATSYTEFMQRCWRVHDNVHVWVGGEMTDPNWAAFDPLFWAHHAMVDRLWRIWQHDNPGAGPPGDLLGEPLVFARGPAMKVRDVLDVKRLGYDYAGQAASVGGPA